MNPRQRPYMTDPVLVEMLSADQNWALREIFDRYNIVLFQIAQRVLRDADLSKDSVQEVFIDLWNRRHSSEIKVLKNYLSTAVKFQSLKQLRNGRIKDHHLKRIDNIEFINQTEESINFEALDNALHTALEQLPPRCKEVFELSRFENLSHKQIAGRLGITAKTVEVQIHKALVVIRKRLDKVVILLCAALTM